MSTTNELITYVKNGSLDADHILDALGQIAVASTGAGQEATAAASAGGVCSAALENTVFPNLGYIVEASSDDGRMDVRVQSIITGSETIAALVLNIQNNLAGISGDAAQLTSDINSIVGDMQHRIGELFSDDCLSNYVQVPILSLDLERKYVSPSIGLRSALQQELDDVKEVTQVVEVVDGYPVLVMADLIIKVKIIEAYVPGEVKSQIESVVIGMLKGRDFNSPLYLSDLYDAVKESSAGIDFVNIEITGPVQYLDQEGNLVPDPGQVIVYGSLSIRNENGEVL